MIQKGYGLLLLLLLLLLLRAPFRGPRAGVPPDGVSVDTQLRPVLSKNQLKRTISEKKALEPKWLRNDFVRNALPS